ncbi:MAG: type II secretion system protein [Phycisphaerales bacterium JB043]
MRPPSQHRERTRPKAFTLLELLVTISIIAILMGLLLPVLSGARESAYTVGEMAAAQQSVVAYVSAAEDRQGRVLEGYSPMPGPGESALAYDELGNEVAGVQHVVGRRYPWRLLPYLEYEFQGLYRLAGDLDETRYTDRTMFQYLVSVAPRMGLNQAFLGGSYDSDFTGIVLRNPFATKFVQDQIGSQWYVERISMAPSPSDLIVFASGFGIESSPGEEGLNGSFKVTPPYFIDRMWVDSWRAPTRGPSDLGNVRFNTSGKAVAALLDGHAAALGFEQMEDMRHWAPLADTPTWTMPHP